MNITKRFLIKMSLTVVLLAILASYNCQRSEKGGAKAPRRKALLSDTAPTAPKGMNIPNGKDCRNGKKAPSEHSRKIMKRYWSQGPDSDGAAHRLTIRINLRTYRYMVNDYYGPNCKSKQCHLDDSTNTPLCGPMPRKFFEGKTSCLDGSDDPIKETLRGVRGGDFFGWYFVNVMDRKAGRWFYRNNCRGKACYFDEDDLVYVCGSSFLRPSLVGLILIPLIYVLTQIQLFC